jgi:hypothetical protein
MLADVFGKERALYAYVFLIVSTSALAALVPLSAIFLLLTMTALCLGFMAARVALERQRHRSIAQEGRSNGAIVRPAANGSILK